MFVGSIANAAGIEIGNITVRKTSNENENLHQQSHQLPPIVPNDVPEANDTKNDKIKTKDGSNPPGRPLRNCCKHK
jgi:hypothetical protein